MRPFAWYGCCWGAWSLYKRGRKRASARLSTVGRPIRAEPERMAAQRRSDQALADGEGYGVASVPQVVADGDVVEDVLHGPRGVAEHDRDLVGVVPVGDEAEYFDLTVVESVERKPERSEYVFLEVSESRQQPPEKVRRECAIAVGRGFDRVDQSGGGCFRAPDHSAGAGLDARQDAGAVKNTQHHDHPWDAVTLKSADDRERGFIGGIGHDDCDSGIVGSVVLNHFSVGVTPKLTGDARLKHRVVGVNENGYTAGQVVGHGVSHLEVVSAGDMACSVKVFYGGSARRRSEGSDLRYRRPERSSHRWCVVPRPCPKASTGRLNKY